MFSTVGAASRLLRCSLRIVKDAFQQPSSAQQSSVENFPCPCFWLLFLMRSSDFLILSASGRPAPNGLMFMLTSSLCRQPDPLHFLGRYCLLADPPAALGPLPQLYCQHTNQAIRCTASNLMTTGVSSLREFSQACTKSDTCWYTPNISKTVSLWDTRHDVPCVYAVENSKFCHFFVLSRLVLHVHRSGCPFPMDIR